MQSGLSRYQTALVLLVLGCVFLALAFWTSHNEAPPFQHIAELRREAGDVDWRSATGTARSGVKETLDLHVGDSIETNEIGEALLDFDDGAQIRILPNSVLRLDLENHSEHDHESQLILILIEHGDVLVVRNGTGNEIISKSGERIPAKDYNDSSLRQKILTARIGPTLDGPPATIALSEAEITSTLATHRHDFFKCYTRLLQKEQDLRGETTLNFSILSNGKTEDPEAVTRWNHDPKNKFAQEEFLHCLRDVLARIEFRQFQGAKISTIFPLKFE